MIRWIPYTFVRTVLFFIAGILVAFAAPAQLPEKLFPFLTGGMALLYFVFVFLARRKYHSYNPGWVGLPLVFLLGYVHLVSQKESGNPHHILNTSDTISHYQAIVTRFPEEKARTWKIEASIQQIHTDKWRPKEGKLILYLSKEDLVEPFVYGDVLLIKGAPRLTEGAANPGEFDYREFLALKNIYHQHFLRKGDVVKMDHDPPYLFLDLAFRGRKWADATLEKYVHGIREQAIASALVLGVTDGLDQELLQAYASTGAMHILAVSGLHVSILYMILLWVLTPLNKGRGGPWFVALVALLILWLYAFVTGLTPSVLRAVTMFSFLALAKPWARSTNIYNTLAVSAFCLLLFDPFLIRSVGFQLSYLAVLGIVYLYPRILLLWEPRHRLVTEVWKISAVSIAAQIATFPLGLLYFHQFPNYFLFSNLLVVPLSFVVLVLGLILLVVSFIPLFAMGVGACLQVIIKLLNAIVFSMESLPFSMIENIYITAGQCALLIALIMAMVALIECRKFQYLLLGCGCVLFISFFQWRHFNNEVNVQKITVYKVPGHSAMDLIDCGTSFFLSDTALNANAQKMRYHIAPNRLLAGVRQVSAGAPFARDIRGGTLITWNGNIILQIHDPGFELPGVLEVDCLVIANNAVHSIGDLQARVKFTSVVLDSSNSFLFASRFLREAKLYNLEVHSVLHQGAYISRIENQDTWSL
ncbi:MAG: ComEC/Rec2 family competence protein [Chryseosolibacter sp.]